MPRVRRCSRSFSPSSGWAPPHSEGPPWWRISRHGGATKGSWLTMETFRNGVALCQTIPGATAMQTSAYVGLRIHGVKGAAASFTGFGLPAFLLMLALSVLYTRFHALPAVVSTFGGLHALIVALIAHAALTFGRAYLREWQDFLIVPVAAALFWVGLSPILVVLSSFLLGIAIRFKGGNPPPAAQAEREPFPLKAVILIISVSSALPVCALPCRAGVSSTSRFSCSGSTCSLSGADSPRYLSCCTRSWKPSAGWI